MGHYVVDEDVIANFQSRIGVCEEELEKYEHDFAVLKDQEDIALKMYTIADNNIDLISILDNSIEYMESVADRDEITGLEEVFNFDDLKISSSGLTASFKTENETFMERLKSKGEELDTKKEEVAKKITGLTTDIQNFQNAIEEEKKHPSKYVEDDD